MKIKLVAITLLLLALLGGLLFSVTAVSANPCKIQKQVGIAGRNLTQYQKEIEYFTDNDVGQCNASVVEAYQTAKANSSSNATASDYGSATSTSNATAYNTISVTQSNTADDITVY